MIKSRDVQNQCPADPEDPPAAVADSVPYPCERCGDRGWVDFGDVIRRPLGHSLAVIWAAPCLTCRKWQGTQQPALELRPASTEEVDACNGGRILVPRQCNCSGFGRRNTMVIHPCGAHIPISKPCLTCDGILTAPQVPGLLPPSGARFDFGRDIIEADLEGVNRARWRNPRIL
jgi:hypothetical protein